jgi:predicted Zn-dependent protease
MKKIEKLIAAKQWKAARTVIEDELQSDPTDHWLWANLGLTYYEERKYEKALVCTRRAVELAPNCPLVLWDFAGCLYMSGQEAAAFAIWTLLLTMEVEDVATAEGGEGVDWAMQLLNDVHYRVGKYYMRKGQLEQAKASFTKYLHNRSHGVGSIYDKEQVEAYVAQLDRPADLANRKRATKRVAN